MLFEECGHYSGECPCLTCNEECAACQVAPDGYAVDTDQLCVEYSPRRRTSGNAHVPE